MTRIIHSESGGPTSGVSASVAQALQTIAANLPAIRQELSHTSSSSGRPLSGYLESWTVDVTNANKASTPTTVLSRTLSGSKTAGGLLVSNPTSNVLTVLLFPHAVPATPSPSNAVQTLVIRPYGWQTIPTVAWQAFAVQTFGSVVSKVTTAILAAFTTIAPGAGLMQEDITSGSTQWWVQTSLVPGDSLSLSSPWGGQVTLNAISGTRGDPTVSLRLGKGFAGKISGSIAGGYLELKDNFSGSISLSSPSNIQLISGSNGQFLLDISRYAYNNVFRLGCNVTGHLRWYAYQSVLVAEDEVRLSLPAETSTFGTSGTAASSQQSGSNSLYLARASCANLKFPNPPQSMRVGKIAIHIEESGFLSAAVTSNPPGPPTTSASGVVNYTYTSLLSNVSMVLSRATSTYFFVSGSNFSMGNIALDLKPSATVGFNATLADSQLYDMGINLAEGARLGAYVFLSSTHSTGSRYAFMNIDLGVSATAQIDITGRGSTLYGASYQVNRAALAFFDVSGYYSSFYSHEFIAGTASYASYAAEISTSTALTPAKMSGIRLISGPSSSASIAIAATNVSMSHISVITRGQGTIALENSEYIHIQTDPGSNGDISMKNANGCDVVVQQAASLTAAVAAKNVSINIGRASALSATVSSGPTRIVVPPSTTSWLNGSPTKTVSGTWVPGNRTVWYHPSSTKTATFTSPVLAIGDCPQLAFKSHITAAKTGSSLQWQLQSQGKDGTWYTPYSATATTAATSLMVSFGPGLTHNLALGQQVRWQALIKSTTTSVTTPSFTLSYSFEGTGGSV